jgi:hypothetical protein
MTGDLRIQGFAIDRSDGSGTIAVLDADDMVKWLRSLPDSVTPSEIAESVNLYALELSMQTGLRP